MSLLLNEVKVCGVPWVLAITNKFSVSAHQQNTLINSAIEAYQAPRDMTVVVNSCPFIIPTYSGLQSLRSIDDDLDMEANRKVKWIPVKLARISFQKRSAVMPVEGVSEFRQLIHHVLASNEEMALQVSVHFTLSCNCYKCMRDSMVSLVNLGNGSNPVLEYFRLSWIFDRFNPLGMISENWVE